MAAANRELCVVRTGAANLASVRACFERFGLVVRCTQEPEVVAEATAVVLPGVGAFGPASMRLRESGVAAALVHRVARGLPLLAVCLGMQLLFEESDEAPEAKGLGVFSGRVGAFDSPRVVPHMGWNQVRVPGRADLLESGYAYFAHSYRVRGAVPGCELGWCEQGERFVAAIERGALLACQFHPELSGAYGNRLLERWCAVAFESEVSAC